MASVVATASVLVLLFCSTFNVFQAADGHPVAAPSPYDPPSQSPLPHHSPSPSPVPQHSPSQSPVPQHSPSQSPVPQHSPSQSPVPHHSPSQSPVPHLSPSQSPVPHHSPSQSPVPHHSPSQSPVPHHSPSQSPVPHHSPSQSPVPHHSPSPSPVAHHSPVPVYPPAHHAPAPSPVQAPAQAPKPHTHFPRSLIQVQGVVYCKSCKYHGVETLLGAKPISGAKVKLSCKSTNSASVEETATTDKHGYFWIAAPKNVSSYASKHCKVHLAKSSHKHCHKPSKLNGGAEGAALMRGKAFVGGPDKKPIVLYTVGPLAFEPKCEHKRRKLGFEGIGFLGF